MTVSATSGAPAATDVRPLLSYRVYGQRILSGIALPELTVCEAGGADITIEHLDGPPSIGRVSASRSLSKRVATNAGADLLVYEDEHGMTLMLEEAMEFSIEERGRRIGFRLRPGMALDQVRPALYGLVLSFVLHYKGITNVHASAAVADGRALALLAESGTGKSTIAAALAEAGYPLLTDDVLALRQSRQGFEAQPGYPRISLSQASAQAILGRPAFGETKGKDGKTAVPVGQGWGTFCGKTVPLGALFVLRRGANAPVTTQRLSKADAVGALLEHTHAIAFMPQAMIQHSLGFIANLTASTPVWSLSYPSGFRHVGQVVSVIADTAGSA